MGIAARELHTAQEVRDNVARTNAYFAALRPPIKSPWQTRYEQTMLEMETLKGERDHYRAQRDELQRAYAALVAKLDQQGQQQIIVDLAGPASVPKVIDFVCARYGIERFDVIADRRHPNINRARQIAMYLARIITGLPFTQLGREYFKRDHSTLIHAMEKTDKARKEDPAFNDEINGLLVKLTSGQASLVG